MQWDAAEVVSGERISWWWLAVVVAWFRDWLQFKAVGDEGRDGGVRGGETTVVEGPVEAGLAAERGGRDGGVRGGDDGVWW